MPRPQILVNVTAAIARRGAATDTGTAFLVHAGATGSVTPTVCLSAADATATAAPAAIATMVGDCLEQGAPKVVLVRAAAVDAATVTQTEWETALSALTDEFGVGQVLIPGVTTPAAWAALLAHCATNNRTALLDCITVPVVATLATSAIALAASDGATRATIVTGATLAGAGGTTRDVPGSVIAAGRAAAGDAFSGHANNAPIFDQGREAGFVARAVGVPKVFTDAEVDTLNDAGVTVIRPIGKVVQLVNWVSLSDDDRFHQLNAGRMSMQLVVGISGGVRQFLGRQIDGRGHLFAELEGFLRGYLQPLWAANALYGETAADSFEVEVASVNTPTTIQAGELHSAIEVSLTPHTEKVVIDVVTNIAEGIAA